MNEREIEEEIALASRTRFVLNDEQWAKFMGVLERPVKDPEDSPRMRKLLTEPSVLETDTEIRRRICEEEG